MLTHNRILTCLTGALHWLRRGLDGAIGEEKGDGPGGKPTAMVFEIDYSTCKHYEPSYSALPANVCTLDVVILDVYVVLFLLFMLNVYSSICSVQYSKV